MIILDTSFLIDYFRGEGKAKRVIEGEEIATTVVSYHEIMTGIKIRKTKKEEKFFKKFFSDIPLLSYDWRAAEESSSIAAKLRAIGSSANDMGLLIAGIAIANGAEKIATRDKDFLEIAKVVDLEAIIY
jgi:hypothetical protein